MTHITDLLIVGGGPAGLAAAINAASEGLSVTLLDSGPRFGGQAVQSAAVENYPLPTGYPHGCSGADLMGGFTEQAAKFGVDLRAITSAEALSRDAQGLTVVTSDYEDLPARGVVIANGLNYRRLNVPGIGPLMGRGVWYGLPDTLQFRGAKRVAVVGGANSAAQAALRMAQNPRCEVVLLVRSRLEKGCSAYLAERLVAAPNITIREGDEITEVYGRVRLERVKTRNWEFPASALFIFIGAVPRSRWLEGELTMEDRFITTGGHQWCDGPFATSCEGVWAVGDIRHGSVKRISAAIGEGAGVVPNIHRWLENRK